MAIICPMHSRHLARFLGVSLALALAYAAQYLLDQPDFYSPLLALLPMSLYGQIGRAHV